VKEKRKKKGKGDKVKKTETTAPASTVLNFIEPPTIVDESAPKILEASTAIKKDVVIQNVASWTKLNEPGNSGNQKMETQVSAQQLWTTFKSKELHYKMKEKEREELEEKAKKQREEREEEMKRKRKELEDQEAREKKRKSKSKK